MMLRNLSIATVCLCIAIGTAQASKIEVYKFDNTEQEQTYKELVDELRCLVCQNNNIADSNAELAQDMRHKTYKLIMEGRSKDEIADYMAERYGDFVLYKPPLNERTWLLWFGPFLLLVAGVILMLRNIRSRGASNEAEQLSETQLREAADLLGDSNEDRDKTP